MSRLLLYASVLLLALAGVGCQRAKVRDEAPQILRIAAAADLQSILPELVPDFEKANPGFKVTTSFGASGALFAQIENGAPFDLFLSADMSFPEKLAAHGKTREPVFQYARGRLVVWVPERSRLPLEAQGLSALLDPSVRKVAIANPEHAPYGAAAVAALRQAGVYEALKLKLLLGENVAQATQFAQSGAAEAALISVSLARSPEMAQGRIWEVPVEAYPPLRQGGVILAATKQLDAAREFRALLLSARGQAFLRDEGFLPPEP